MGSLPDLSRFELQCLRKLWSLGEASVRDVHEALSDPPSYSTVRKIIERLEEKGAVTRLRMEHKAWIYTSTVSAPAMIRKEVRRFLDSVFDGVGGPLIAHLADMEAVSLDDLRDAEALIEERDDSSSSSKEDAAEAPLSPAPSKKKGARS